MHGKVIEIIEHKDILNIDDKKPLLENLMVKIILLREKNL